jgi:hypothetical protein
LVRLFNGNRWFGFHVLSPFWHIFYRSKLYKEIKGFYLSPSAANSIPVMIGTMMANKK